MGRQWKQWQTLFWGGSKITADGDCSHEIKRYLLLGSKFMTKLDSILKSKDITLTNKGPSSQIYGFPLVMYGCESWTIKKAECWRIDGFELWAGELLRVPWTARRSNWSILKEISPEYSLEGTPDLPVQLPEFTQSPCPLSRWCHPTISSSVVPFSSRLSLSQHLGLFQRVSCSHQVAKILQFQLQHQSFQWIFRTDLL